ncbi:MAG: glycosyltransferase family 4 protein [Sphingomonas sp.]|nr:glycosyltransferase family 4 protein [Sphingomonas sp.]
MARTIISGVAGLSARLGLTKTKFRAPDGKRQLLVDVSTIARTDAGTGIQRVVRALWLQLRALDRNALIVTPIVASRRSGYRIAPADFLQNPIIADPATLPPVAIAEGDVFLGLDLALHVIPHRAHELRRWQACGVRLGFVVYDLLPVLHPYWFSPKINRRYVRWIGVVARHADEILCIARAVQDDLENWIEANIPRRIKRPRMSVIRLGGDIVASAPSEGLPIDAEAVLSWARNRPTILMVGTIEPRKGYDQALAAFEYLWSEESASVRDLVPSLLIVGRPGWMTEALQDRLRYHREQGRRLRWIDDASDEYLGKLYEASTGFLFASQAEGFGLPILEAAGYGKPILARDLPVFREIAPDGAAFFQATTGEELAGLIKTWLAEITSGKPDLAPSILPDWTMAAEDLVAALGLDLPVAGRD